VLYFPACGTQRGVRAAHSSWPARSGLRLLIIVCGLWGHVSAAHAELRAIWALDDGTKVRQSETSHPLAAGNETFDAKPARVKLFGARNETVAFQLMLVGGARATPKVRVRLDAIGPIRNGKLSSNPDLFYRGRRITLFRQHYVRVRKRSASLTWKAGSASEPKNLSGMVPDPLSPLEPTDSLTVPANRNQGIWVDIYIPKDVAPGTYQRRLRVSVGDKPCPLAGCQLAVSLNVLPVTLPDETSTKTMVYFSGGENDRDVMPARYFKKPWEAPLSAVRALRARHFRMGRRHRVTLFIGQSAKPNAEVAARLSGATFSREAGYEGPGVGLGQDVYSIHTYGKHDGKVGSAVARRWRDWLRKQGRPDLTYFLYMHDEPGSGDFARINRLAKRAAALPSFVTHDYDPALSVDIYCALAEHYSPKRSRKARAAGKKLWIYNGVRPFSGSFMIDDVAVAPRVNAWIQHKYGIERWFYWESTYYKDVQGGRGHINVWREAWNFSNWDGDKQNGDGLLLYPGRDLFFPAEDKGFAGPLPSIRLKNWRRGLEDVEYLILARKHGHGARVDTLLQRMVPRALADRMSPGKAVAWPEDGQSWLRARRELAALLRAKGSTKSSNTGSAKPRRRRPRGKSQRAATPDEVRP
jgi:hypothetical protein